jgi:hypothetical protein
MQRKWATCHMCSDCAEVFTGLSTTGYLHEMQSCELCMTQVAVIFSVTCMNMQPVKWGKPSYCNTPPAKLKLNTWGECSSAVGVQKLQKCHFWTPWRLYFLEMTWFCHWTSGSDFFVFVGQDLGHIAFYLPINPYMCHKYIHMDLYLCFNT